MYPGPSTARLDESWPVQDASGRVLSCPGCVPINPRPSRTRPAIPSASERILTRQGQVRMYPDKSWTRLNESWPPGRERIGPDASWTGQDSSGRILDGPGFVCTCSGLVRIHPESSWIRLDNSGQTLDTPEHCWTDAGQLRTDPEYQRTPLDTPWICQDTTGHTLDTSGHV